MKWGGTDSQEGCTVMHLMTTNFIRRLRDQDESAWFELWQVFGPVLRNQLARWGRGRIGLETVRDLSQETLASLARSIDRFDPGRGVRFSTWLLAIARHVLFDEIDRRMAKKRGSGVPAAALDERFMGSTRELEPDELYERQVFEAKVHAALRRSEAAGDFVQFQVYRMKIFDGKSGRDIAVQLGISEPTVTRHVQRVRSRLRDHVREAILTYSFTDTEEREAEDAGLGGDDRLFDEAIAEIYERQEQLIREDEAACSRG